MDINDKIRILLIRRKMTIQELAYRIGTSPQNLSNKLSRNNFSKRDLDKIADALGCYLEVSFIFSESGERF